MPARTIDLLARAPEWLLPRNDFRFVRSSLEGIPPRRAGQGRGALIDHFPR